VIVDSSRRVKWVEDVTQELHIYTP
jgi:hypothetical protein